MTGPTPAQDGGSQPTDGQPAPGPEGPPAIDIAAGIGPGVSGWWLRILHAAVCLGTVLLALQSDGGTGVLTVIGFLLVFLAGATVLAPHSIAGTLLILAAMAAHLLGQQQSISVPTAVLAALLLAVHQLSGICAAVPPRSIVHPGALRPALLRFVLCAGVVLIGVLIATLV